MVIVSKFVFVIIHCEPKKLQAFDMLIICLAVSKVEVPWSVVTRAPAFIIVIPVYENVTLRVNSLRLYLLG